MSEPNGPAHRPALPSLLDPPLLISVAAEALAGAYAGATRVDNPAAFAAAGASALLFAAGTAFNRYFQEAAAARPSAPGAYTGRIAVNQTGWRTGWALLLGGIGVAALAGRDTALMALAVALALVLYAALTRPLWGFGFLNLAVARGLNVVLGLSASGAGWMSLTAAALPVTVYVLGWSLIRGSRQPGAPTSTGFVGLVHLVAAFSILLYQVMSRAFYRVDTLPFLLVFVALTYPRFVGAVMDGRRPAVMESVQYGFLGLTLLAATLAAGADGIVAGVIVTLFCLPLYWALRRWPIDLVTEPR